MPGSMTVISVGRNGQEIGNYDVDGLKQGLASGFFLPNDWGWYEGLTEWLPLSQIVEKLSVPPSVPVPPPPPPVSSSRPAKTPKSKTQVIKQDLATNDGQVSYLLKKAKPKGAKPKKQRKPVELVRTWRDDPATDKQITFLHQLGAKALPPNLSKGQAHDMIDARLNDGHPFLSPKQMACLSYHGYDPAKLNYDEAKDLLDEIHEYPEKFKVPEPWETAKYHLYPKLYPSLPAKGRGCLSNAVVLFLIGAVGVVVVGKLGHSVSVQPSRNQNAIPISTQAASPQPSVPLAPPPPVQTSIVSESAYHGFNGGVFGKGWVRLKNGVTIFTVSQVVPASGGKVSIVNLDGEKDISASDLPQGFLDEWGITAEKLKAMDKQAGQ
jgi:hypothetical protein